MSFNDIISNTPRKYIFKLKSTRYPDGLTLDKPPLEWKEGVLQYSRDIMKGGIVVSFQVDSLTIIGTGARHLKQLFEADGINAKCSLHIYKYNFLTRTYIEFPSYFSAKFISYKIVKVGKFAFGVNIEFIDNDVHSKIVSRSKVKLNLLKRFERESMDIVSLGGTRLSNFPDLETISKVKIPALKSSYSAKLSGNNDSNSWEIPTLDKDSDFPYSYTNFPMTVISSDIDTPYDVPYDVHYDIGSPYVADPFFKNEDSSTKTVSVTYRLGVVVTEGSKTTIDGEQPYKVYISYQGVSPEVNTMLYEFGENASPPDQPRTKTGTLDIEMAVGTTLSFYITSKRRGFWTREFEAHIVFAEITVVEQVANTNEKIVEGLPLCYALHRAAQLVLDEQYPFYSEHLGLTDLEYKVDTFYASTNQLTHAHIFSGLNFRGLSILDFDTVMMTTLEELIESSCNILGLGMGLEIIDGQYKIRIEPYSHFFQNVEALDLSYLLTFYDIEQQYMSEMAFVQVITGFENFVFKSSNGRGEYNTENTRTTFLETDKDLDLKSKLRADTMGIVNCISKPVSSYGSEDMDEDNHLFILKTQRDDQLTHQWIAETDENIAIENGTSLFKDSSLNLFFTPARNMVRNAAKFMAAMYRKEAGDWAAYSSKLRFQTSGKTSSLETTGEGYTIIENQDIDAKSAYLSRPPFIPMKLIVSCDFDGIDLAAYAANPNGYIKLTSTLSGYVIKLSKKNAENKATIELIQKI